MHAAKQGMPQATQHGQITDPFNPAPFFAQAKKPKIKLAYATPPALSSALNIKGLPSILRLYGADINALISTVRFLPFTWCYLQKLAWLKGRLLNVLKTYRAIRFWPQKSRIYNVI